MADQVKYTNKLNGAKVLVLGGTSGIGYAVAEAAVEHGATVIVSSSNPGRVEQAVSRLQKAYPSASAKISGYPCDLNDENTLESNIIQLLENAGPGIDHIVHTAAGPVPMKPLADSDFQHIKQAGIIRFFSHLMLGKHASKYLKGGRESSITFTTAGVSERPMPGWSVITGYMSGQHGICRSLALDLKPIRVNLVLPGAVDTEFWTTSGFSDEKKKEFFTNIAAKLPLGKVPGPEDVAEAYLYLMKDPNVTGTVVSSNAGWFLV